MMRSVGAVLAGVGANLLAIPVDVALTAGGLFSGPGAEGGEAPSALALAYRLLFAGLGGWVTARLAPSRPLQHGLALGALGLVFASLGAAANWGLGHHWYPLSLIVGGFPATLAGTRLFTGART